jgi:hypothetical protein
MTPEEYLKTTNCPDCHADGGICEVCWAMENDPDLFITTPEQWEQMEKAAEYVIKNGITPNLDSIY